MGGEARRRGQLDASASPPSMSGRLVPAGLRQSRLRQEIANDFAGNVGKPKVSALVKIGQAFVVDSQAMQDRGVKVMNVNRVTDDVVGE